MKNRLYYIFFFLLSAVVLHAQQADTASSKDFDFDQAMDDLTDLELFADALAARYAIKVSNTGKTANMPLYEFIDAFLARTSVHVGIQQNLKSENPFGSFFDVRRMRGNYIEGQGQHGLIFSISFVQQKDHPRFYKILIDIEKVYTESASRIDKDNWPKFDDYIDTINNSTQTYTRADFKSTVNTLISESLFILLGIRTFPLEVTINPLSARSIDSLSYFSNGAPYEQIIVNGKPKSVTNVALKLGESMSLQTAVSRMEIDSVAKNITISNGSNFKHQISSSDSGTKTFTYTASRVGDDAITATYDLKFEDKTITETAGKLNVSVYPEKKFKLKVVPVNLLIAVNEPEYQEFLNAVYGQCAVSWEVEVESQFEIKNFDNRLDAESGLLSNYSSEMNSIINAYKREHETEKGTYYIFVVPEFENSEIFGYMPMKRSYGFVSCLENPTQRSRTMAHELGHGTFRLKHTFSEYPSLKQGYTDNMMDYVFSDPASLTAKLYGTPYNPEGAELRTCKLYKYQWDYIHNPEGGIYWFQDEEDVMAIGYVIDFTMTESFVKFDKQKHENFIKKYTPAYESYHSKGDVSSGALLNQYLHVSINNKTYKTNSVATLFGRDHARGYMGRFHNVFEIDELLKIIIGHSDYVFYDLYVSEPIEICVKEESVGFQAKLDYKWELFRILKKFGINQNDLVTIDGVVYNANEIGNYIWGMVLTYHGVFVSPNLIAELGTNGRKDEPWEQRAITQGKNKTNTFNFSEQDKQEILGHRLFFRTLYNNTNTSWRQLNPFDDLK